MNVHVRACVQSVHHQHAYMISDGHASMDDVPVKVKTSLHQAFLQVVDVMNLCFSYTLLFQFFIHSFIHLLHLSAAKYAQHLLLFKQTVDCFYLPVFRYAAAVDFIQQFVLV